MRAFRIHHYIDYNYLKLSLPVMCHEPNQRCCTIYSSVTVTASRREDRFHSYSSNYGSCVDIIAPVRYYILYVYM